jgi:hypothetical protein
LTQHLQPLQVDAGKPTKFECTFTGDKPLTIAWQRDQESITNGPEYQVCNKRVTTISNMSSQQINTIEQTSTLTIIRTRPENAGKYTCRIENVAGSVETAANLQVVQRKDTSQAPTFTRLEHIAESKIQNSK